MDFKVKIIIIALVLVVVSKDQSFAENCNVEMNEMANLLNALEFSSKTLTDYSGSSCDSMVGNMDAIVEKFKSSSAAAVTHEDETIKSYQDEMARLEEELRRIPDEIDSAHAPTIKQLAEKIAAYDKDLDSKIRTNGLLAMHWENLRREAKKTKFLCPEANKLFVAYPNSLVRRDDYELDECDVPKDKIINALTAVKKSSSSTDSCSSMLLDLKNGLLTYEQDVFATSVRNVTQQTAALEDAVSRARTQADSLRNYLNQKYAQRTSELVDRLQDLMAKLVNLNSENQKLLQQRRTGAVQLSALLIACGNPTKAMKYFDEYNDLQMLKDIISTAFVNVEQMDKVVKFIEVLSSSSLKDEAGLIIADKLPPSSQYAVILDVHAKKWNARRTQNRLKPLIEKVSDNWAAQLLADEADEMENVIRINVDWANAVGAMLPDLVRRAYNNQQSNAKRLISPLYSFHWVSHQVIGLRALVDEMVKNQHLNDDDLICVALRAKQVSEGDNLPDVKKQAEQLAASIWPKLPIGVKNLLFDPFVTLRSRKHDYYTLYGSSYGNIYGYPNYNYDDGDNQKWYVGKKFTDRAYFSFRNKDNDRNLYADNEGHAYSRKPTGEDNEWWSVMAVHNAQYFYFKNKLNSRVLDVNDLENCLTSSTRQCSTVHAYDRYVSTDTYQEWSIQ